jgi:hypothetical protein
MSGHELKFQRNSCNSRPDRSIGLSLFFLVFVCGGEAAADKNQEK